MTPHRLELPVVRRPPVDPALRRARWSVILLFVLNGLGYSNIVIRYPLITTKLGMSNALLGVIVALGPLCGLVTGLATSTLIRRFGSQAMAAWSNVVAICCVAVILNAPNVWLFAAGVILMSTFDVYTDTAMNAEGMVVQKLYQRSIINSFHAWWSVGAALGGGIGSLFAAIQLPLWQHSIIVVALMIGLNVLARKLFLPAHLVPPPDKQAVEKPARALHIPKSQLTLLIAIGLIAAFGAWVEEAAGTWSALYLKNELGTTAGVAGVAFIGFMVAQTLGRFTGDAMIDRLGDRLMARIGCSIAAGLWIVALIWPSIPLTVIAFIITGWGVATVVPAAYYASDMLPGLGVGDGLTIVNWILRLAFLVGPPLVGFLSDLVSLRFAFILVPVSLAIVLLLSPVLSGKKTETTSVA